MFALLGHYFKISFRSIWKDKVYSLINLVGLTVAMACCFLLVFWIRYEYSFEKDHPNADRIYQVIEAEIHPNRIKKNVWLQPPAIWKMKEKYPFVEEGVFMSIENGHYNTEQNDRLNLLTAFTYREFLTLFPLKCVAGTLEVGSGQWTVFLTEEVARRYFGSAVNAVGKQMSDYASEQSNSGHTIQGVISLPANSHIRFEMLRIASHEEGWMEFGGGLHYLLVKKGYKLQSNNVYLDEKKQTDIRDLMANRTDIRKTYLLQPLKDVHLYTDSVTERFGRSEVVYYGDYREVRLFAWVAFFVLLLAIINYVNTSTARAMSRSKEVGVRKVAGAQRKQLVARFLIESFLLSVVAVVLAIDAAKWMLPAFEDVMGNAFPFLMNGEMLAVAAAMCVGTTLLSGGYAAFYLSSFHPMAALKGGTQTGSRETLRKWLTGIQFVLSIGVLICTAVIYRQLDYMLHKDLGFDRENVYELATGLWYESEAYQQVLCENPYVIHTTMAASPPFDVEVGYRGISWEGCDEVVKEMPVAMLSCDYRFATTFGLQVTAGEFLQSGYTWWQDIEDKSLSIVINETFVRQLKLENPIGAVVRYRPDGGEWEQEGKVVGVVRDFFFKPLQEEMIPLIINFNPEITTKMYVKIRPEKRAETLAYIKEMYYKMRTDEVGKRIPYMITSLDTVYERLYHKEIRLEKLLVFFSILSVFLSCMGIFGMISFQLERRTREIALRKINGAKVKDILTLFFREQAALVGLASLVALPVAWLLMHRWMEQYVYRTSMGWWVFILIPVGVWLLTIVTIALQVYHAARRNPVEALRRE